MLNRNKYLLGKKFYESIENMGTRSFTWMNSACKKNYLFVRKSIAVITLRENVGVGSFFKFFLNTIFGADRYDFDFSAFKTIA